MPRAARFYIVLVTCSRLAEARKIARAVVEEGLAACVNITTAPVESIYAWKGKLETSREYLLIIKTSPERLKELEHKVLRLHSYETPEFVVLPITSGSAEYLAWLKEQTRS